MESKEKMTKEINLNHICKVEGHAHLSLKIENNKVKICELKASEGARFFEALVLNKRLEDVQEIVSRICGICSSAHTVASIQGLEEALKINPSNQQLLIREMLTIGERVRSHATHLYFLTLPDYFNAASALALGKEHKDKINDAIALITLGNKIVEAFGGREIHPFLKIKEKMPNVDFSFLLERLKTLKPITYRTIELFTNLDYPSLNRETEYLSLKEDKVYASISGKISSGTGLFLEKDYKKHLAENIKEYATSKFALKDGKPLMVGAMSRINNNHEQMDSESKIELDKVLNKLNIKLPFKNPFHNNICQAIELLYMINRAIYLIENYSPKEENISYKKKEGIGVSAVEAPRGTLYHEYKIDKEGKIVLCNIITPTVQNLNMMEIDITSIVNKDLSEKKTKEEIIKDVEKLIRAYDPCFSCSTHFLKVTWL
ncbi:MAG: Ni/Fe hydrogenase subunit alpha [Candidatus Pacearchaeota archaeon]|jgi:sulfhydrogenase subunit alpha